MLGTMGGELGGCKANEHVQRGCFCYDAAAD